MYIIVETILLEIYYLFSDSGGGFGGGFQNGGNQGGPRRF